VARAVTASLPSVYADSAASARRDRLHPGSPGRNLRPRFALGGRALIVKDGTLTYVHNFPGIPPEDRISAPAPTTGGHVVDVEFNKERAGEYRECVGPLKLYIDDQVVGEEEIRTVLGHFSPCGEGLCIGYDSGDAISGLYAGSKFEFTGGTLHKVVFDIADDAYIDVEAHLAAAMARD
jgi:hypothetical protein